jgi:Cupin domain
MSTTDQTPGGAERLRISSAVVAPDTGLSSEDGWIDMEVRWLITEETVGSTQTVVGRTVLRPGSKHVGDDSVRLEAGDVVFVAANVFHGLENASDSEPVVTVWGYSGASCLEAAGYELPAGDHP